MRLQEVRIKRYRCIWEDQIAMEPLTAIVGPNGAGKSTVLSALRDFYASSRTVTVDDFYNRDQTQPIEISLSFGALTPEEQELFRAYTHRDTLTVTKVITEGSEKYHGSKLQHPEFVRIRRIGGKRDRVAAFRALRNEPMFVDLAQAGSADDAEQEMSSWEAAHPEQCQMALDDGQFFGFRNVGQSRLERFTRFVLVPAVRDADFDAADRRGSAIFELLEMVVRSSIARNQRINELKEQIRTQYAALVSPDAVPELAGLASTLTTILRSYVPSAFVQIDWASAADVDLPAPKGEVRLSEDGFLAPVDRVGHGLQRAFILSLLQVLTGTQANPDPGDQAEQPDAPDLILAIEEPELYQHPNRQRHFARVLRSLADGRLPGVARRTQVLYCTHSPLFVDISMFNAVRRLRKVRNAGEGDAPLVSKCSCADAQSLAVRLEDAQRPRPRVAFTGDSLIARCGHLMGPMLNEGFFADVAVLVEGEEDRAAILGCAEELGFSLEALGVAILPVSGKTNLDRPFLVFSALQIPTYVVFDSDVNRGLEEQREVNCALQRLVGVPEQDVMEFPPTRIGENYGVFSPNLTEYIRVAAGADYDVAVDRFREEYGYPDTRTCQKSSRFVASVVQPILAQPDALPELRALVHRIATLSPHAQRGG